MVLIELPVECIYQILSNLDANDIFRFLKINKSYSHLFETRYFWIFIAKLHYKKDISYIKSVRLLKNEYIKMYKSLCQHCGKRAYSKHMFYDKLICYNCETKVDMYKIINPSRAKREYGLTDSDLKVLNNKSSHCRRQKYNKMYYLLTDVINLRNIKFPDKIDYLQYIINKLYKKQLILNKKLNKERMIIERFIDLDLNFNTIRSYINQYTNNRYKYFIQKNKCSEEELFFILKDCFELYYIINYTNQPSNNFKREKFEWILLFGLLDLKHQEEREQFLNRIGNVYFEDTINKLKIRFSQNFCAFNKIKNLLSNEYDNYFISNYSSIFVYSIRCLEYKIYEHIMVESKFDVKIDDDYYRGLIENDILEDFFIYNTVYNLLVYSDVTPRTKYEYRKEAYEIYRENNDISNLNSILKSLLDRYFI